MSKKKTQQPRVLAEKRTAEYDSPPIGSDNITRRPLLVGCSGGGGHIAGIKGIHGFLNMSADVDLPRHIPKEHQSNSENHTKEQKLIYYAARLIHDIPFVSTFIRQQMGDGIFSIFKHYPVIPTVQEINEGISALNKPALNYHNNKIEDNKLEDNKLVYIDMLLDVYPAGYESAAIWNTLQKQDRTRDLAKLIKLQKKSDDENYKAVYDYYSGLLSAASKENKPYTEIISTQAMALPALCQAVLDYNNKRKESHPEVRVHQYLTDLPTPGAVHFGGALGRLDKNQSGVMALYGVGLTADFFTHFKLDKLSFAKVHNIDPRKNPMVRPGFKNPEKHQNDKFDKECSVSVKIYNKNEKSEHTISANDTVATIMLGSQASNDTVDYAIKLAELGYNKIFVFAANSQNKIIKTIEKKYKPNSHQPQIIVLGNQDDEGMTPIMTRSNCVIIRGGGLSVMEQLAMPHNPKQTVLFHHKEPSDASGFIKKRLDKTPKTLTSGIAWEDANIKELIKQLTTLGVHTDKTTTQRIVSHARVALMHQFISESFIKSNLKKRKALELISQHDAAFQAFMKWAKQSKHQNSLECLLDSCAKQIHTPTSNTSQAKVSLCVRFLKFARFSLTGTLTIAATAFATLALLKPHIATVLLNQALTALHISFAATITTIIPIAGIALGAAVGVLLLGAAIYSIVRYAQHYNTSSPSEKHDAQSTETLVENFTQILASVEPVNLSSETIVGSYAGNKVLPQQPGQTNTPADQGSFQRSSAETVPQAGSTNTR